MQSDIVVRSRASSPTLPTVGEGSRNMEPPWTTRMSSLLSLFPPCCPSPSPLRLDGEETQVWTRGQLMEKEEAKRRASYFRPYRVQLSSVDARPHRYAHTQPLGKRGELGAAGWAGLLVGGVGAEGTVE